MVVDDMQIEIIKDLISGLITLFVSTIILFFGWIIGKWFNVEWNIKQKRREIQLD